MLTHTSYFDIFHIWLQSWPPPYKSYFLKTDKKFTHLLIQCKRWEDHQQIHETKRERKQKKGFVSHIVHCNQKITHNVFSSNYIVFTRTNSYSMTSVHTYLIQFDSHFHSLFFRYVLYHHYVLSSNFHSHFSIVELSPRVKHLNGVVSIALWAVLDFKVGHTPSVHSARKDWFFLKQFNWLFYCKFWTSV